MCASILVPKSNYIVGPTGCHQAYLNQKKYEEYNNLKNERISDNCFSFVKNLLLLSIKSNSFLYCLL